MTCGREGVRTIKPLPKPPKFLDLFDITAYARLQDPAAVFTNPNYMVLKIVDTMSRFYIFHGGIIPPPGSFIHG